MSNIYPLHQQELGVAAENRNFEHVCVERCHDNNNRKLTIQISALRENQC